MLELIVPIDAFLFIFIKNGLSESILVSVQGEGYACLPSISHTNFLCTAKSFSIIECGTFQRKFFPWLFYSSSLGPCNNTS